MIDPMDELAEHKILTVLSDAQEIIGGLSQVCRGLAESFESIADSPSATYNMSQFEALKTSFGDASKSFEAAEQNLSILQTTEGIRLLKLVGPMLGLVCSYLEAKLTGEPKEAVEKINEFLPLLESEYGKSPETLDMVAMAKPIGRLVNELAQSGKKIEIQPGKSGGKEFLDIASGLRRIDRVLSRQPRLRE